MGLIGQNQQTSFANPQNGQTPMDADVVRTNDNALVAKHNAHDADATIHVQTGALGSRPAAGTANALYVDTNGIIYRDDGSAWTELPYVRESDSGTQTVAGNIAVTGNFAVDGDTALDNTVVDGTLDVTGAVGLDSTLDVAGAITGSSGATITGTVSATTLAGSASGLTNIPTGQLTSAALPSGVVNATNIPASRITAGTAQGAITAPGLVSSANVGMTGGYAYQTPRTQTVSGSTANVDCSTGNWHEVTLNASSTLTLTNLATGQEVRVFVKYGGAYTITFASVQWSGDTGAPIGTGVLNKWDTFVFCKRSDGTIMAYVGDQNHS